MLVVEDVAKGGRRVHLHSGVEGITVRELRFVEAVLSKKRDAGFSEGNPFQIEPGGRMGSRLFLRAYILEGEQGGVGREEGLWWQCCCGGALRSGGSERWVIMTMLLCA